jgi:hypothetical protein
VVVHGTVPRLRWSVATLSSKRLGFDPDPANVRFVVDKLTLGNAFSKHIGFSHVKFHSTIAPNPSSFKGMANRRLWNTQTNSAVSETGEALDSDV